MFKRGKAYRHDSTIDMDLHVCSVVLESDCCSVLYVKYWNRHYKMYQPDMISTELVRVKTSEFSLWKEVSL